jgi:hypothetical protein
MFWKVLKKAESLDITVFYSIIKAFLFGGEGGI